MSSEVDDELDPWRILGEVFVIARLEYETCRGTKVDTLHGNRNAIECHSKEQKLFPVVGLLTTA